MVTATTAPVDVGGVEVQSLGALLALASAAFFGLNSAATRRGVLKGTVLQGIAKLIRESTRQSDIAARYGGEEFVLLFPETDRDTTATICNKILQSIENQVWRLGNDEVRITVSIGAADNAECRNAEELLERADERLYKAKNAGKNQVVTE